MSLASNKINSMAAVQQLIIILTMDHSFMQEMSKVKRIIISFNNFFIK